MSVTNRARAYAFHSVANSLSSVVAHCSDDRLLMLVKALRRLAQRPEHKDHLEALQRMFEQKHPALKLARRLFSGTCPRCQRALINNLGVNATYLGGVTRHAREHAGLGAPSLIVISPTMRCNLDCYGCFTGQYGQTEDLPWAVIDQVIQEGKSIGTHFYGISGGEPFVREDLFDICAKHNDCEFLVYTTGALISAQVARRLADLGNVAPALSMEGFQEETDGRRGAGAWDKIMAAMDRLHEAGVMFGFSATVTSQNADTISSESVVDLMVEKGCYCGWYFTYIPIGREPDTSLMPTPEQRLGCGDRVTRYRAGKPSYWLHSPGTLCHQGLLSRL